MDVVEELIRGVVVGHEDVRITIAIVIGDRHTHTATDARRNARLSGDVSERAVPIVAVKRIGQGFAVAWIANDSSAVLSIREARALRLRVPPAVIRDEEIKQTVVVVVQPGGGYRPHPFAFVEAALEAGFDGHFGEGAIPVVVEQLIPTDSSYEQIRTPIIVIISDGRSDAIPAPPNPDFSVTSVNVRFPLL